MAYNSKAKFWRSQVRVPQPLMDWVKERTEISCRSLNSEIVEIIREAKDRETRVKSSPV